MDLVFTIIILLFVIVYFFTCDTTEGFADTATKIGDMSRNELEATIYQIYKADVLAIKNLADTATKLQVGGLTIPGNLGINGNQKVDGKVDIKGDTSIGGTMHIKGSLIVDDVTFVSLIKRIKDLEDAKFVSYNDRINLTLPYVIDGGTLNSYGSSAGGGEIACFGGANSKDNPGRTQLKITKVSKPIY
jgi:hypothetical protein